jgi:molecular chaperone GrpE
LSDKDTHNSKPEDSKSFQEDSEKESNDIEKEISLEKLDNLLEDEKQKLEDCQEKLKHTLADYQNLERKTKSDIDKGVNLKTDKFLLSFLSIYDDFIRAKKILYDEKIDISGLESIVKNMNSLLLEYGVTPINAIGEIFNPNFHEAVSVVEDPSLDDGTITKEIRKGYISQNRVIRPTIVEISKKLILENSNGEKNG